MVYGFGAEWAHRPYIYEIVDPKGYSLDDAKRIKAIDDTYDGGVNLGTFADLESGKCVHTDNFPKVIKYLDKRPIPDIFTPHGFQCVSEKLKEIIESIEPKVHQFVPIEFIGRHKVHLADMFIMVVCNRIDSVDREHTKLRLETCWREDGRTPFTFNKLQIGNAHMWRDKLIRIPRIFISDTLAEALHCSGLTGFTMHEGVTV